MIKIELKNKQNSAINVEGNDIVKEVRNWYHDRYSIIIAQRNLLLLLIVVFAVTCMFGILYIKDLSLTKTIKPFIIQVEENSGVTTVVDGSNINNIITRDEGVKNYFIIKYIRARETYSSIDYKFNYDTVVRLMSDQNVYSAFRRKISNADASPIIKYADNTQTNLLVRSIQYDSQTNIATVRFKITESGQKNNSFNKIATLKFELSPMTVAKEESFINPIGFKVTSYRVDDEILDDTHK